MIIMIIWSDRDVTVNHIISQCSKETKNECKSRHGWVGKGINWETSKGIKFSHVYGICEPEYVQEKLSVSWKYKRTTKSQADERT